MKWTGLWEAGKVRAYGWSTDFASVSAVASRDAFVAVEH